MKYYSRIHINLFSLLLFLVIPYVFHSTVNAQKAAQNLSEERPQLIERIIAISQQTIANPAFLETEAWKNFVHKLRSHEWKNQSDKEFRQEFNRLKNEANLPFTHFQLNMRSSGSNNSDNTERPDPLDVSEITNKTVMLKVRNFSMNGEIMTKAIGQIHSGNYNNLIIDLRGNRGGSFPPVVALGRYLTNDMLDTGVYLTRKWFVKHGDYPTEKKLSEIPVLQDLSLEEFKKLLQSEGAARMILPPHSNPIFKGKVYILTNKYTGSASEPFAYLIKKAGIATIIGEKTAGAMQSGEHIPLNKTFSLFVPAADYMTADGHRIDKVGVSPDIKVPSEEALNRTLAIIEKNK